MTWFSRLKISAQKSKYQKYARQFLFILDLYSMLAKFQLPTITSQNMLVSLHSSPSSCCRSSTDHLFTFIIWYSTNPIDPLFSLSNNLEKLWYDNWYSIQRVHSFSPAHGMRSSQSVCKQYYFLDSCREIRVGGGVVSEERCDHGAAIYYVNNENKL